MVASLLLLTGCTQSVEEITSNDNFVDETVSVRGVVKNPVKLGDLSGYTLTDSNGDDIIVASDSLPSEGDKVTAKGTLKKGIFGIGYYIDTN